MQIDVHLHGILRDQLPREAKGRATITVENGATMGDLLKHLGIQRRVVMALNDKQEPDESHILHEGDRVSIFTVIGGG